jgi:hypothetical protein
MNDDVAVTGHELQPLAATATTGAARAPCARLSPATSRVPSFISLFGKQCSLVGGEMR